MAKALFCIVLTLLAIPSSVKSEFYGLQFVEKTSLTERILDTHVYDISNQTSLMTCMTACVNSPICLSFSFKKIADTCFQRKSCFEGLHQYVYSLLEPELGWRHFELEDCREGWVHYGDSYYFINNTAELDWYDAKGTCEHMDSWLAEVEDPTEQQFLVKYLSDEDSNIENPIRAYWIGGSDTDVEGLWLWAESGTEITYHAWDPFEPNNVQNEDCIMMLSYFDYKWADYHCNEKLNFICERMIGDKVKSP